MKRHGSIAVVGAALMWFYGWSWGAGSLVAQVASSKERFELLHKSLLDLSQGYVDDVLKTIGFLLLIIGWIVTSKEARTFLRKSSRARVTGLIVIVIATVVHVVLAIGQFNVSRASMAKLDALTYMPHEVYDSAGITVMMLVLNLILHIGLFALLFRLVYSLRQDNPQGSRAT